ncbi:unnamed protein product [[Candida] boidinii]|uniref:Unnamed protein product n=1 Tax=Candida boidinii TaxID=5477 RepID=A0A9W6T442_CANBO|nr:unnamed protein product [[Candida] boidinii]
MLKSFISNYLKDLKIFKQNYFNSHYLIHKFNKSYYTNTQDKGKSNKLMVFKSLTNSPTTSPRTKSATVSSSDVPTSHSSNLNNSVTSDAGTAQNNETTDGEGNDASRSFVGRWRGLKHVKSQVFQEDDQNDSQSTKINGNETDITDTQDEEMGNINNNNDNTNDSNANNDNNNNDNLTANKTRSSSWAFWQISSPQPLSTKDTVATDAEEQRQPDTETKDSNDNLVSPTGVKKVIVNGKETSTDPASTSNATTTSNTTTSNIDKAQRSQSWSIWNLSRLSFSDDPNSTSTTTSQSANPNSKLPSPNVILTSTFENLSNLSNNNKTNANSKDTASSKNFPPKEDAVLSETSYVKTNEDQNENNEPDKKKPKKRKLKNLQLI